MADLAIIETLNAVDLFENHTVNELIDELCKEYRANVYDISDEAGRKAIASDAKLINKWSTSLDGLGKDYVAVLKSKPKLIDTERKKMRDTLAELRTEILQPLTDWENAEKLRQSNIQARINNMMVSICGAKVDRVSTLEGANAFAAEISQTVIDDSFEEFKERAENQKDESLLMLSGIIARFMEEQAIAEKEAKLIAEANAKAQIEHEERIAKDAARNARIEAEAKAAREKQEILDREQKAIDDAAQAERDKIAAQERAKLEQEKAVQAEKDRAEKARQDEIKAEAARARNTKHKGKINNEALDDLVKIGASKDLARKIVIAIARGTISNVSIKY